MKKYIILFGLILVGTSSFAFDAGMSNATLMNPSMGNIGVTPAHDMQMIKDLKLRYEIYNDVKQDKEERIRQLDEPQITEPTMRKILNRHTSQQDVQFVEENGKIKIQSLQ